MPCNPIPRNHIPRNHLIIFARFPRDGQCKTRLIPALGPAAAAAVHRELVTSTTRWAATWQAETTGDDRRATVVFTGASAVDMGQLCGSHLQLLEQSTGDLGQRLDTALHASRDSGCDHSLVVGTDCPALGPLQISRASHWLETHDVVLGPASDGGYYLIGVNHNGVTTESQRLLFNNIDWGTDQVLQQTLLAARSQGLRVALLETLDDIDRPDDLRPWWNGPAPQEQFGQHKLDPSTFSSLLRLPAQLPSRPQISVVIPVLRHEPMLASAISSVRVGESPDLELLVVAAEASEETLTTVIAHRVPMIASIPGRGRQLNAGATASRGEVLLFLHADSQLPMDYRQQIDRILSDPKIGGGAFRLAIASGHWAFRLVEFGANLRSRWWGVPYGDQAIFVRRKCYESLGGFREWPLMEDYDFAHRLRQSHGLKIANSCVMTSPRRWNRLGIWRTWLRNQRIIIAYRCGYSVGELGKWY